MKKELSKKSIHELRILGRSIGVKSVTTLKKDELIEQIISVDNGTQKPFFSNKGRPALKCKSQDFYLDEKSLEAKIDAILQKAKKEILDLLSH